MIWIKGLMSLFRVAESYVPKTELSTALDRVEGHMVRIENKLDALINKQIS